MTRPPQPLSRAFRLALRAFPRSHRRTYASEMVDAFERELGARRARSRWRAARFGVAACLNAVSAGLDDRRRRRRARGSSTGPGRPGDGGWRSLGRDLRLALRALIRSRAFTIVTVVSLGIGIAVVVAMLVFLRTITGPAPGINPNGLVELLVVPTGSLRTQTGSWAIDTWSHPDFDDLRSADTGLTLAAWTAEEVVLRLPDGGGAVRVPAMYATQAYFAVTGVELARGRTFDDADGALPEVVIGHRLWQSRLGSDPAVVGRAIVVNGVEHTIVGVAPEPFRRHLAAEESPAFALWLPLRDHARMTGAASARFDRRLDWIRILGRLDPGVTLPQADAAVAGVMQGLARQFPDSNSVKEATVEPYFAMGARLRPEIWVIRTMFLGAASVVLLIVCVNVSGMMLVRSATRERELAVRLAIGASRRRLVQALLCEAFVLALAGGVLGTSVLFSVPAALAWWYAVPLPPALQPDARMIAICLGLCAVTSLVFGLMPAVRFSRPSVVSTLKDEAGGGGRRVGRVQRLTGALQAGIAIPFLVIGLLKLEDVRITATADLGFEPEGLFAAPLDLGTARAAADPDVALRAIQASLAQASGVTSVTVANGLPLDFQSRTMRVSADGDSRPVAAHVTRVAPDYLKTMDIALLRGRDIASDDRDGAPLVAMLSAPLASRLFPGADAVGRRVTIASERRTPLVFEVIGVTADVVTSQMGTPRPQLYVPLAQLPATNVTVIARSAAPAESMRPAFERAFADLDPDVIRSSLVTGHQLVRNSMFDLLTHSAVAGVAAMVALALAALGVFGVVAFMVATRTREIGVRVALGASRARVLGTVLLDAAKLAVPGIALGLVLAVFAVRMGDVTWYSLGVVEPLVYLVAAAIALAVVLLAGIPSARRAARVDPLVAMRVE